VIYLVFLHAIGEKKVQKIQEQTAKDIDPPGRPFSHMQPRVIYQNWKLSLWVTARKYHAW
jgi:hypothetical protein